MKCEVSGAYFDPQKLIYRDLGFGEPVSSPVEYKINILDAELLNAFADPFKGFANQCQKDDEEFLDVDIPEIQTIEYPTLELMLVSHRQTLSHLLRDFLYFQLLDALFGKNPRSGWRFAINTIVEVVDEGEGFFISRTGYFLK